MSRADRLLRTMHQLRLLSPPILAARLAEELDASLARENELQKLADEASAALGSAIAEVRAALERQGEG